MKLRTHLLMAGMIIAATAVLTPITAQASETGVITAMSEKVYLETSEDATVLENILQGTYVEVILTVTDGAGGVWYYVRTDSGLEGYMPAGSVGITQAETTSETTQTANESAQNTTETVQTSQQTTNNQTSNTQTDTTSERDTNNETTQDAYTQNEDSDMETELILTATDNVNLRALPDATSTQLGNITRGTEVEYTAAYTNEAGELWYAVTYMGTEGYVIGTAVDAGEYPLEPQPWSETVSQEPEQTDNGTDTEQAGDADAQENAAQATTEPETATAAEQAEAANAATVADTQNVETTTQSTDITSATDEQATTTQTTSRKHRIELFEVLLVTAILLCAAAIVLLIKKIRELLIYKETRNERKQANAKRRK